MLPGAASVMTAAIESPCSANAASSAGGVGQGERREAAAGGGQQGVDVPVVEAGELDHLGAAGNRATVQRVLRVVELALPRVLAGRSVWVTLGRTDGVVVTVRRGRRRRQRGIPHPSPSRR